jgi:hypothetical protein
MTKVINMSTVLSLADVVQQERLNQHIQKQNAQGWELMSSALETTGIQELLLLFWKKTVEENHGC